MRNAEVEGMALAVAEAFEAERAKWAGQIAALTQTAQAAQEAAAGAVARAAELSAQLEQSVGVARSAITQVEHDIVATAPSALTVDGWRLVLCCADGRRFEAELPRPDLDALAVLVVERHLDKLRGEKGEKGEDGPPVVVDVDELATALRTDPEFVAAARGEQGQRGEQGLPGAPATPWAAGVYRADTRCSHFLGRVYEAQRDTAEEPGDSADWRRLDTTGMRHIGPREPAERGDIHIKEGATLLYDGARSWLLSAKAFTTSDGERLINPVASHVKGLRDRVAIVDSRSQAAAELAGVANANASEALRWITARAEAIDALLGDAP